MANLNASTPGLSWLFFASMTVVSWGLYGVFLHSGQVSMADPVNGRYKAFLVFEVAGAEPQDLDPASSVH